MFEVVTIYCLVGFVVVSTKHGMFVMSSSLATTLGVEIIGKGDGRVRNRRRGNQFLLHNERINATNAQNGVHDQDLGTNVGVKTIQSF